MSTGILVIINPHAGGGRAGRVWNKLEPLMVEQFGDLVVAITEQPHEVLEHLDKARAAGLTRVIAIGGDGTSHAVTNAILDLQQRQPQGAPMVFGQVPLGTGQDFARSLQIPAKPADAIRWLAKAQPQPLDVGCLEYDGQRRYFLNIASVGMSGEVDRRVNKITNRRPWTFWLTTVRTLLGYQLPTITVKLDGIPYYSGKSWLVAVSNGAYFGRGMAIAPHAQVNDGLFDVILVKGKPRLEALRAFNTVYSGKHLLREDVLSQRAALVEIEAHDEPIPLDLDGEYATGRQLRFEIQPGALQILAGKK